MKNLDFIVQQLLQDKVVAYPTETVYGLGVNPYSTTALDNLIKLKQRDSSKGFILIAPSLDFFNDFIDFSALNAEHLNKLSVKNKRATTYLVPALNKVNAKIKGNFVNIAVRISQYPSIEALCNKLKTPIISTSANISMTKVCDNISQIRALFGDKFPILEGQCGGDNPSQIIDLISGKIIRN